VLLLVLLLPVLNSIGSHSLMIHKLEAPSHNSMTHTNTRCVQSAWLGADTFGKVSLALKGGAAVDTALINALSSSLKSAIEASYR
jgi:hypothetical protein